VRGHHDAVASYNDQFAAIPAALGEEFLLSVAIVIDFSEVGQPVSAPASDD